MQPSKILKGVFIFTFFIMLLIPNYLWADRCREWFDRAKIKKNEDCVLNCAIIRVDMGTFHCHSRCPEFCKATKKEHFIFKLSELYPGLTAQEKALSSKEPLKMLIAYRLTWKTEKLCLELFLANKTNDESDACRHFIWAALLQKEFGTEFSIKILNAHEQDPKQPESEKSMDLANNRLGLLIGEKLLKQKKFSDKTLLKVFKKNLKKGHLIILNRSSKKPGGIQ